MKTQGLRVVFCGGGTGGHLFPGLAVAEALRQQSSAHHIHFMGSQRGLEATVVPGYGFGFTGLEIAGLYRIPWRALLPRIGLLPRAFWQARLQMQRLQPHVVVGLGGYASAPGLMAARMQGCKMVLMEQNAYAGITTRLFAPFAQQIFCGMPCRNLPVANMVVCGNPVRQNMLQLRAQPFSVHQPRQLLVLGGSQGARPLNRLVQAWLEAGYRLPFAVHMVHQTGKTDAQTLPPVPAMVHPSLTVQRKVFIEDMAAAYAQADLVLCRAGAMTLAELAVVGRGACLVPFAAAAQNHQHRNAEWFVAQGAAQMVLEQDLQPDRVWRWVGGLLGQPSRLTEMAAAAWRLGRPHASAEMAAALLRYQAR